MLSRVSALLLIVFGGVVALFAPSDAKIDAIDSPVASEVPRLQIAPSAYDFGRVPQFSVQDAVFQVTNHFPRTVVIREIAKSCGCSATEIEPRVIAPGGTAKLTVRWKVGDRRGAYQETIVLIACFDAVTEPVALTQKLPLVADVIPEIDFEPREIRIAASTASQGIVTVRSGPTLENLKLLKVESTLAGLTAKLGSAPLTLEYSFDPKAYNRGWERPVLRLATTSLRETWLTIPVIVE